jgi:hypothetical protein
MVFQRWKRCQAEPKFPPAAHWNGQEAVMTVMAILVVSSFFVLAAMVGLADAFVCFVRWSAGRLSETRTDAEPAQPPAHGITA